MASSRVLHAHVFGIPSTAVVTEALISFVAGIGATFFAVDLWRDYRRKPRPHVAAYGAGITMFAIATWALFVGLTFGWTGPVYRTFFLFGAILNIPVLAIGSMFLVVGKRSGHALTVAVGALAAISTTLTLTVPFENPLPTHGIPVGIFPLGFSPRLFAIIGGALGTTILVALSVVSLFRFWRMNRSIVWGNALILLGVVAAAWQGTGLALGDGGGFALSLLIAVSLIWAGYRVASGKRNAPPDQDPEPKSKPRVDQFESEGSRLAPIDDH
jgi:hypothetical protein